jgi:hypothetical protein
MISYYFHFQEHLGDKELHKLKVLRYYELPRLTTSVKKSSSWNISTKRYLILGRQRGNPWKKWRVGRKLYKRIETGVSTSFCTLRHLFSFSFHCILKSRLSTNMSTNVNVIQILIAHNKLHVKVPYKDYKCVRFKQIYFALNTALCFIIKWLRFQY